MNEEKPYGEVLDEMDHQAKYQSATVDKKREDELRIQALGAAISRRDWHAAERAYEVVRDKFYEPDATCSGLIGFITKAGLENWRKGDGPENHVLLRTGGDMRVALYAAPSQRSDRENAEGR